MSRAPRCRRAAGPRGQRGAALLMAIAVAGLLTAVAVEIAGSTRDEVRLAAAFRDGFRARWAVRAPVEVLAAALREEEAPFTGLTQPWARLDGTLRVDDIAVRFRVEDEGGKLNLNGLASADPAVRGATERVLLAYLDRNDLPAELARSLRDWVDADAAESAPGAEGVYYQGLRPPYPVKNAPLDAMSELRLVQGFTPARLRRLEFPLRQGRADLVLHEVLTVYSDLKVNVNTAPPVVLENLVEGIPEGFIADLLETRKEQPIEKLLDLKQLDGMDDELYNKVAPLLSVSSRFFSVTAEATAGRIRKRLVAVLRREDGKVSVLFWRVD